MGGDPILVSLRRCWAALWLVGWDFPILKDVTKSPGGDGDDTRHRNLGPIRGVDDRTYNNLHTWNSTWKEIPPFFPWASSSGVLFPPNFQDSFLLHSGTLTWRIARNGPGLKMYFLSKMGIHQPAMSVYQKVPTILRSGLFFHLL